jgi:hypothetical protein
MSVAGIQTANILPFNDRQVFFQQRGQDIRQLGRRTAAIWRAHSRHIPACVGAAKWRSEQCYANVAAGPFRNPKVAIDFAALGQALQAGDLAVAQQAFATFRQDLRSGRHQNGAQQPANSTLPEIVINLRGILPNNSSNNTAASSSGSTPTDASSSSSGSTSGTTGQTASSTSAPPEIVLNVFGGNGSFAGPEIIFNFGNNGANSSTPVPAPSSSDQRTGASSTQNSQNPEIIFNLANSGVSEIDLNLGGSNPGLVLKLASQPSSSGSLNVIG